MDNMKKLLKTAWDAAIVKSTGGLPVIYINNKPTFDEWYEIQVKNLTIPNVGLSLPSELEMHEQATSLYEDEDYGDAKYDGFMKCFRLLAKGNN